MKKESYHRVKGVGKQRPPNPETVFDPRTFERAIHGLQQMVMDMGRLKNHIDPRTESQDEYSTDHTYTTNDDGEPVIQVDENSMLYDVTQLIPRNWDVSVLCDIKFDNSFAVHTSTDCGGEIVVWATFIFRDGMFRKLNVGHTCLEDPSEDIEVRDFSNLDSSRILTHLNRYLEREADKGYAITINSAATAFDFIGTKADMPPSGPRPPNSREMRERSKQKDWGIVRDKTKQTISDNVRSARAELRELPENTAFAETNPSLIELDPDSEDPGDISLV